MTIQRWDVICEDCDKNVEMVTTDGDFVKFDDHAAIVKEKDLDLEELYRHHQAEMLGLADAELEVERLVIAVKEKDEEIKRLRDALNYIACFSDLSASDYLEATGSYSRFDEPHSVEVARKAIARQPTSP